jgi:hypothetical protein
MRFAGIRCEPVWTPARGDRAGILGRKALLPLHCIIERMYVRIALSS